MKKLIFSATLILSLGLAACGDDEKESNAEQEEQIEVPAAEVEEAAVKEPEEESIEELDESVEEVEPPVEEPLNTEESIKKFIKNTLGERTNTSRPTIDKVSLVDGSLNIELNANDNVTIGFIRDGMLSDSKGILKHIRDYDDITDDVFITYLFDVVDSYGNTKSAHVLRMRFTQETLNEINFDSFSYKNFDTVADNFYLHQAFK